MGSFLKNILLDIKELMMLSAILLSMLMILLSVILSVIKNLIRDNN